MAERLCGEGFLDDETFEHPQQQQVGYGYDEEGNYQQYEESDPNAPTEEYYAYEAAANPIMQPQRPIAQVYEPAPVNTPNPPSDLDGPNDVWMKRTVSFSWSGSLLDLSGGTNITSMMQISSAAVPSIFSQKQNKPVAARPPAPAGRRNVGAKAAVEKTPSTRYIVREVTLKDFKNTFPCSLNLNIDGVKGLVHSAYTSDGTPSSYVIFPKTKAYNVNATLFNNQNGHNIKFLRMFPGWDVDNIETGIVHIDELTSVVQEGHPCLEMLNRTAIQSGQPPITSQPQSLLGYYNVLRSNLTTVLNLLKKDMEEGLPITDMIHFGLNFNRAFVSNNHSNGPKAIGNAWLDSREIYDGYNTETSKNTVNQKTNSLYVTLEIEYKSL